MGRNKKDLHACDKFRKQQKQKDLKRNQVNRKTHREELLTVRTPAELLSEIYRINRAEAAGTSDEKMAVRRKQLIEAHKAAIAKQKQIEEKKDEPEEEAIVIKGMSKIFKSTKSRAQMESNMLTDETAAEGSDDDESETVISNKENVTVEKDATKKSTEKKQGVVFSQAEEESMVFDESIIEEVILEVPPGIRAPPGIRGNPRPPGTPLIHLPMNGMHPMMTRSHHPLQQQPHLPQQLPKLSNDALGPAPGPAAMPPKDEPSKPFDPLDPSSAKTSISAKPEKPSGTVAPKLAFMPVSLMVKNRPVARPVRPALKATKIADERAIAKKRAAAQPPAASPATDTTEGAYDQFMQEMDAMGAFEEDSD